MKKSKQKKHFIHNAIVLKICFCRWAATVVAQAPHLGNVAVLLCFPNVLHFHLHIQDLRGEVDGGDVRSATRFLVGAGKRLKKLKTLTPSWVFSLRIQSPSQMVSGVYNHLLRKVFRFHYHSQKVIGSLGPKSQHFFRMFKVLSPKRKKTCARFFR